MDIKKVIKAAMIPAGILIAISVGSTVVGAIPVLNFLLCCLGIPIAIANIAVLAWSGYAAVKEHKLDLVGGVLTGGLAGFAGALVGGIVSFVFNMIGFGANVVAGGDVTNAALGGVGGIIGIIIGIFIGTVAGLILGAIGAFVAGMKK
ncbi:hypothetical protein KKE92_03100 [Candidatus Micrarchaeota archaeon]|nr:hypothetical protein [Candidatus Micrarchaeota archaeon]MBU1681708.1 hypothetical protein [Candidatus Micrarchaeota archaeon]